MSVQTINFSNAPKGTKPEKVAIPPTGKPKVTLAQPVKVANGRDAYRANLASMIGQGPEIPGLRLTPTQSDTGTLGWVISGRVTAILPDGSNAPCVVMGRAWLVGSKGNALVPGRPMPDIKVTSGIDK